MFKTICAFVLIALFGISPTWAVGPTIDPLVTPTKIFACDLPVRRENGTPLAIGEIARVDLYRSNDNTTWVPAGTMPTANCRITVTLSPLPDGQYYYLAKVVDTGGRVSPESNVVPFVLTRIAVPAAPVLRLE